MEGLRKTLKDLRMSGVLPKIWTRHLQNTSLVHYTAQTLLVYNMNIFGVYRKKKILVKLMYVCLNIASILLNAVVAVSYAVLCADCLCWMSLYSNAPWQVKCISASDCSLWHCLFLALCSTVCCVLWFHGKMCSKECCLFRCDSVLVGRNYPHMCGRFCCTFTILTLVWEHLASSKSS